VPGAEHAEWIAPARRIAPTIDGVEYYRYLRRALIRARREVFLVGWDFHSEVDLLRGEEAERAEREDGWPVRLADLLERLVEEREELRIRILIWEGASLFALERQHLPRMKRPWSKHPRLRLEWDRDTPQLGSQHEKLVVVDDRLAFVGGMDVTRSRWDDSRHAPDDERRRNPGLWPSYGVPYHDLMLAVDGEAARVVRGWARERWRRATGEEPEPAHDEGSDAGDPWPPGLEPLLREREVAFVRTQPDHGGREEKRQVERAWLAQIRAARRLIHVETQYFACEAIAQALADRLREPDGPEVVLILPYGCPGALQSMAMDTRRDELLDRLREADRGGRLGVYWPTLRGGSEEDVHEYAVYVHAKTMVVDDRLLRIGSSNLNERSMGLDAELDAFLQIDEDEEDARRAVAGYRRRLLAYLLHVEPERVAAAEREHGGVVAAIEALRGGRRTLYPFDHRAKEILHALRLPVLLADPPRPLSPEDAERVLEAMRESTPAIESARRGANVAIGVVRRWKGPLTALVLFAAAAAAWRFTPLRERVDAAAVRDSIESLRASPLGIAGVLAAFVVLATLGFPVTVLLAAIGATFEPALALPLATAGVTASAWIAFGVGRAFPAASRRRTGRRLQRIGERFAGRGVLAIALLRNVPIAPFALVNVGCGTARVSLRVFLAGTLLGMLPGIVLLGIFGREAARWLADPGPAHLAAAAGIAGLVVVASLGAGALLRRRGASGSGKRVGD